MKSKQSNVSKVGLYMRLSRDDERNGESLSIENQRTILHKYVQEHGFIIYDEYVDDGISGTTFNRPSVQRLLDDAKTGVIDTIIVKDLSRFGRNYIEVGQYIDYIFPSFGIRFIAIQDNVDTSKKDSSSMEMMPIMNVFNEWHAANTSKKIRATLQANAREGKYHSRKAPYGYIKGTDEKRTPVIDEEAAKTVKRIFEMRASGISPRKIAETLNSERIPSPARYALEKHGQDYFKGHNGLWVDSAIKKLLKNPLYLGHMVQQRLATISYKNHKKYTRNESEWITIKDNHPAIISQELWDKVREVENSVSQGKLTKRNFTHPLSGFLFCADCGGKMKLCYNIRKNDVSLCFNCGKHARLGKSFCFSHFILAKELEEIILFDVREKAKLISLNEKLVKDEFIRKNNKLQEDNLKFAKKQLLAKEKRLEELKRLIQVAYEDRVKGIMPENLCFEFIEKYSTEQKVVSQEIDSLKLQISQTSVEKSNVDDFISNIKKYIDVPELTRELCYNLFEKIVVGGLPRRSGKDRTIDIIYKVDIAFLN